MPRDVRQALHDAAVTPVAEPDWATILRRGRDAQRRRSTMLATSGIAVVALAWGAGRIAPSMLSRSLEPADRPPAGGTGAPDCFSGRVPMTVFFEAGVRMEQIDAVRNKAGTLHETEGVYLIDRRGAYKKLVQTFEGIEEAYELPHHAFPAWLAIRVRSVRDGHVAARALRDMPGVAEIEMMSTSEKRILCEFYQGDR